MRQCPNCLEKLNSHKQVAGDEIGGPEEGCYTICIYCGFPLRFGKGDRMSVLSKGDLEGLSREVKHALGHAFVQAERFNAKKESN